MRPVFGIDACIQGFVTRSFRRVQVDPPFDPARPIHPLNPWQRRPMPQRPFRVSRAAVQAIWNPAADVFAGEELVTVDVDLPGEASSGFPLNVTNSHIELEDKRPHTLIGFPPDLLLEGASSRYRNARRIPIA